MEVEATRYQLQDQFPPPLQTSSPPPGLYKDPSAASLAPRSQTRGSSPSMMEAHHRHQRHKTIGIAIVRNTLHLRRNSSRALRFLVHMLHFEYRTLSNPTRHHSIPP